MILIIDNYDSFTYNLVQYLGELTPEDVRVIRNDAAEADAIIEMDHNRLVISPGPGRPENAGICMEVVKKEKKRPILGVCLGHQVICESFGHRITYAKDLYHGKTSRINIERESRLFKDLPGSISVGRYHSLAADRDIRKDDLYVTSRTVDGEIMSVEHSKYDIFGIQFHPESILTEHGKKILKNFLEV